MPLCAMLSMRSRIFSCRITSTRIAVSCFSLCDIKWPISHKLSV
uniref:Uncharacterized protein n=1 Tax=Anguilla anguilla TaxID=7936 RepID=A0A0E9V8T5_ANGAN